LERFDAQRRPYLLYPNPMNAPNSLMP